MVNWPNQDPYPLVRRQHRSGSNIVREIVERLAAEVRNSCQMCSNAVETKPRSIRLSDQLHQRRNPHRRASQSFKMSRCEQAGVILIEPRRLKDLASRVRENRFLRRCGSFGMTAGRIPQTETLVCPDSHRRRPHPVPLCREDIGNCLRTKACTYAGAAALRGSFSTCNLPKSADNLGLAGVRLDSAPPPTLTGTSCWLLSLTRIQRTYDCE
jgi:hypothetical protein